MFIVGAVREKIPLGVKFLNLSFPVVLPTDTLYGICADATNPEAVEKIYTLKWRNPKKPLIVLVSLLEQIEEFFGIEIPKSVLPFFNYPKPISVLLKVGNKFSYISRGSGHIAFRLVKSGFIKEFLDSYGKPIVAPSANWEGFPPAETVWQALLYFGNSVAVYYDGGKLKGEPSALIKPEGDKVHILRKGCLNNKDFQKLGISVFSP
jgi:L-threonylcarbamoyladenylate synthase